MNQLNPHESDVAVTCGRRLREAREAKGMTVEAVASRLKMPAKIVQALEADDWSVLGAPIYVRGQVRSYARLLGLEMDVDACLDSARLAPVVPPELVSHSHVPPLRRFMEQATRRAIYIVMTLAIAVPAWFATGPHLGKKDTQVESLEVPAGLALPAQEDAQRESAMVEPRRTTVVASMTPRAADRPVSSGLELSFDDESWIEVFDFDGNAIEKSLVGAGEERRFDTGKVASVKLGNAAAVEVRSNGDRVDLAPFSRGTVARFRLSSDGSVVPPTGP